MEPKPERHTFIYLLGPSASGKTYTVENKLLGKEIVDNYGNIVKTLPDYAVAIDGGDMRAASKFYQRAITI